MPRRAKPQAKPSARPKGQRPVPRTDRTAIKGSARKKAVFLKSLAGLGLVTAACADAGVPRRTVYDWRDLDEAFRAAWDDAIDQATELLEREARRRAYTGVLKPVFQGGRKVGEVREYSDVLLIFTLKALRPEKYRDRSHVTHQGMSLEELVAGSREGAPVWDPPSAPAAAASPFHHNREGTA